VLAVGEKHDRQRLARIAALLESAAQGDAEVGESSALAQRCQVVESGGIEVTADGRKPEQLHLMLSADGCEQTGAVRGKNAPRDLGAGEAVDALGHLVEQAALAVRRAGADRPIDLSGGAGALNPGVELAVGADVADQMEGTGQPQFLNRRPLRVGDAHAVGAVQRDEHAAGNRLGHDSANDGLIADDKDDQRHR
jgi:hypothetical protein